ncbi:porin [Vibrio tubiashii]|uniref:porin n=1 Tax=Vibrio tubiashii TaxID=29498 RepID=UPI001EFC4F63|nr:porin [Vibrio tubiashii]MCG9582079.1 porin [Vibrio tubiashii]MCG9615670.1 porin [Vibrio tubiashii]MCG9687245.1 porin [Vibrio tubiashii]
MEKVALNSKAVKLTTLALAVAASNQTYALEMYNDETTKLDIYGAIGAHITRNNFDNGETLFIEDGTLVEDPGSYVGVSASHTLAPFSIYAALEGELEFNSSSDSLLSNSEDFLVSRQVYIGVKHDDFGSVSIGKQESPYMVTDIGYFSYWAGGSALLLSDQLGSRRTANTVVWGNAFEQLEVRLQYQAKRSEDQITFGNGYNAGALFVGKNALPPSMGGDPSSISAISVKDGYAASLRYTIDETIQLVAAYNRANDIFGQGLDLLGQKPMTLTNADHSTWAVGFVAGIGESTKIAARYENATNNYKDGNPEERYQTATLGIQHNWLPHLRSYAGFDTVRDNTQNAAHKTLFNDFHLGTAFAPVPWGEIYLEYYNTDHHTVTGDAIYLGAGLMF